jgi:DNA-binding winged helix-turn-helix (wHTH) protein
MSLYLIDQQIVLDDENFLLYRHAAPAEEQLRLGAISSRCLALLLQANGAVVLRRQIMDGAWGRYGLQVTDNSLAQVVRQLRLALERLQPGCNYIVTLPRIGYKLAEGVHVVTDPQLSEALAAPKPVEPDEPQTAHATADSAPADLPSATPFNAEAVADDLDWASPQPHSAEPDSKPASKRTHLWLAAALLLWCGVLFGAAAYWARPLDSLQTLHFNSLGEVDGVQVFLLEGLPLSSIVGHRAQLVSYAKQLSALTPTDTTTYLYLFNTEVNHTFIACNGPLEAAHSRCRGARSYHGAP